VSYGVIYENFDKLARKEIMRVFSKVGIEKEIYFKTTKEIWDKLESIYEVHMQVLCDVKRLSLVDGEINDSVKYSKRIEDHESYDDSFVSRGKIVDQHPEDMWTAS